jgi:RNA polymerase sigma-70 factor (ECF subfamily)
VDDAVGSLRPGTDPAANQTVPERRLTRPAARTTSEAEFTDFYRQQTPGLVAFVMWLGASAADAADVTQETMFRAFLRWKEITHPRTWVRVVASREYLRCRLSDRAEPVGEISGHLLPPGAAADEAAMLGPEVARVLDLLRLLPDRQRQVMAWAIDGYSPAEIAENLNISPVAVRGSLHKARATLKHQMEAEGGQFR